ncbi:hypothetical protein, partial [Pseudomonas sp. VI4.1]|uniref:hypothetical protein n=1 Tax=Pseudomonas sp. VI4.1 TaxID=1941346 RepID=UPI001C475D95
SEGVVHGRCKAQGRLRLASQLLQGIAKTTDSAIKPKLKRNGPLQYSQGGKQPYSRVATGHCVQSPCFLRDTCQ